LPQGFAGFFVKLLFT